MRCILVTMRQTPILPFDSDSSFSEAVSVNHDFGLVSYIFHLSIQHWLRPHEFASIEWRIQMLFHHGVLAWIDLHRSG
jgi:hypothetical protein